MRYLREHADRWGAHVSGDGRVLRYRGGSSLMHRRYDHLWHQLGQHLPWVAVQQMSTHWLRHTTLTWVECHFGYAVARAYADHTDHVGRDGATPTYVRAGLPEIAAALAVLGGEEHPLASAGWSPAGSFLRTPIGVPVTGAYEGLPVITDSGQAFLSGGGENGVRVGRFG